MEPFFFVRSGSDVKRMSLLGGRFSATLGERKCIGYVRSGRNVPCPYSRKVDDWYCNECRLNDDFFQCVRCTGNECINEKQRPSCRDNVYFLYIAAFGPVLKVGISYEFRITERLVEQGADFAAKVAYVKDGKEVRMIEQEAKKHLGIADRITGEQKHKTLFGDPNASINGINSAISMLRNSCIAKYMIQPEIYDLRGYYRLSAVPYAPDAVKLNNGVHMQGECLAAKGNILVFQENCRLFSINAHDMIGRELLIDCERAETKI